MLVTGYLCHVTDLLHTRTFFPHFDSPNANELKYIGNLTERQNIQSRHCRVPRALKKSVSFFDSVLSRSGAISESIEIGRYLFDGADLLPEIGWFNL